MEIIVNGLVGVFVVRFVGVVIRSELEFVIIFYFLMVGKIVMSKDWELVRNVFIVLSDFVYVSNMFVVMVMFDDFLVCDGFIF